MKLFGRIAWKSFDSHFDDIIENLKRHSELFRLQMEIASHEKALEFHNNFEQYRLNIVSKQEVIDFETRWDEWAKGTTSMLQTLLHKPVEAKENGRSPPTEYLGVRPNSFIIYKTADLFQATK